MTKLNIKALAISFGAVWGLYMALITIAAGFGWGLELYKIFSSLFLGMKPSFLGVLIGAIWGFIDGAIAGAIIGLIYNKIVKK